MLSFSFCCWIRSNLADLPAWQQHSSLGVQSKPCFIFQPFRDALVVVNTFPRLFPFRWFQNRYSMMVHNIHSIIPSNWVIQIVHKSNKMAVEGIHFQLLSSLQIEIMAYHTVITTLLYRNQSHRNSAFGGLRPSHSLTSPCLHAEVEEEGYHGVSLVLE